MSKLSHFSRNVLEMNLGSRKLVELLTGLFRLQSHLRPQRTYHWPELSSTGTYETSNSSHFFAFGFSNHNLRLSSGVLPSLAWLSSSNVLNVGLQKVVLYPLKETGSFQEQAM